MIEPRYGVGKMTGRVARAPALPTQDDKDSDGQIRSDT